MVILGHEAHAPPSDRLDDRLRSSIIIQGSSQFVDEITQRTFTDQGLRPERFHDLIFFNHTVAMIDEVDKKIQRFGLDLDPLSRSPQFEACPIHGKIAKANDLGQTAHSFILASLCQHNLLSAMNGRQIRKNAHCRRSFEIQRRETGIESRSSDATKSVWVRLSHVSRGQRCASTERKSRASSPLPIPRETWSAEHSRVRWWEEEPV